MCASLSSPIDPEHQRASGNLKYFEYIMSKEKESNKSTVKTDDQIEKEIKVQKKGRPMDYLPERQKYEMLCRGEGLKMVIRLFNVLNQCFSTVSMPKSSTCPYMATHSLHSEPSAPFPTGLLLPTPELMHREIISGFSTLTLDRIEARQALGGGGGQ